MSRQNRSFSEDPTEIFYPFLNGPVETCKQRLKSKSRKNELNIHEQVTEYIIV